MKIKVGGPFPYEFESTAETLWTENLPQQGWQCPVCKACFAPTMVACLNCTWKPDVPSPGEEKP